MRVCILVLLLCCKLWGNSASDSTIYDPPWAVNTPTTSIVHSYNGGMSSTENGALLKAAILALSPGEGLEIESGNYSIDSFFDLNIQGTSTMPIWVCASEGASVTITRPNANQNIINLGASTQASYLVLRGIEFVGGSIGLRLYDCANLWIDQCEIHNTDGPAVTANTNDTSFIYVTRNEIHDTNFSGEGLSFGGNNGSVISSNCVIALNHIYNTNGLTVSQGEGIEIKTSSFGNWIAENIVHGCNFPCISVGLANSNEFNLIEKNICYSSNDNVMQVVGDAIVRNNLCMDGFNAFASQPLQGNPDRLTVVHNTFVNTGNAVRLDGWAGASNMSFANNACYSQGGDAINVVGGTAGIVFDANVAFGALSGLGGSGFTNGTGLADFTDLSWDAAQRDGTPSSGSPLLDNASNLWATLEDIAGTPRVAPHDVGAFEGMGAGFLRGDCNVDGTVNVADAVTLLSALFGGSVSLQCDDACDANDDGGLNVADPIKLLDSLFGTGVPLADPIVTCGVDPTSDALDCGAFDSCP